MPADVRVVNIMRGKDSGRLTFHDPIFQTLHGPSVGAMWRMLLQSNASLAVTFDAISLDSKQTRNDVT